MPLKLKIIQSKPYLFFQFSRSCWPRQKRFEIKNLIVQYVLREVILAVALLHLHLSLEELTHVWKMLK